MTDSTAEISADRILADPSASRWLKRAVIELLQRDPVDAATDAEVLMGVMERRFKLICGITSVTGKAGPNDEPMG